MFGTGRWRLGLLDNAVEPDSAPSTHARVPSGPSTHTCWVAGRLRVRKECGDCLTGCPMPQMAGDVQSGP